MMPPVLVPCFACGKTLDGVFPGRDMAGSEMQPSKGVMCFTHGNYGSQVYDPYVESEGLQFVICDDCLIEHADRVREIFTETQRPIIDYRPWDRGNP